jgi:uncharacterized repeat protein (TIGR01451 family)
MQNEIAVTPFRLRAPSPVATLLVALLALLGAAVLALIGLAGDDEPGRVAPARAYGDLPISFEPNSGSAPRRFDFVSRGQGYSLALAPTEVAFALATGERSARPATLAMRLDGAATTARPATGERLPGEVSYLTGNDPARWRTGIPTYGDVTFRAVYPGIDVRYHGDRRRLEYDFEVAAGASPERIALAFDGARSLRLARNGDLRIALAGRTLTERAPVAFQTVDGRRRDVPVRYVVDGSRVGFALGRYDRSLPLTIDPLILTYSSLLGGSAGESGGDVAVDAAGAAYLTGQTESTDFPASPGAPDGALTDAGPPGLARDAYVAKLAPDGQSLVYATYLGGVDSDVGAGIEVDADGAAYVTGPTLSTDFPTTAGADDTTCGGCDETTLTGDAFAAKLAPDGQALTYSTYLGGAGGDGGEDIAIDAAGAAYVTGSSGSSDFPVTAGAFDESCVCTPGDAATNDAFAAKLTPAGDDLAYATFLGGDGGEESGAAIAVDGDGAAYVGGATRAPDFPATSGSFDGSLAGGSDAFAAKLTPAGDGLGYATYLGGGSDERVGGIAIDGAGAAYLSGPTASSDFPATSGAADTALGGAGDAFAAKLAPAGDGLAYASYVGGSDADLGSRVAVDAKGTAYLTGSTSSADFPTTVPDATDGSLGGPGDAFLARMAADGGSLIYSSYVGGTAGGGSDSGAGVALGARAVHLAGSAGSTDFPTTAGSALGGSSDAFAAKLGPALTVEQADSRDPVLVGGAYSYEIVVRSVGPAEADDVVLTDTLPGGAVFVGASAGCGHSAGTVTCALGDMDSTDSRAISIAVNAPPTVQQAVNTASVTATGLIAAAGDSDSETTSVVRIDKLISISKAGTAAGPGADRRDVADLVLCGRRPLSLMSATKVGRKVKLAGVVSKANRGKRVTLLASGRKVGTAKASAADGLFKASVAAPPKRLYSKVRYAAALGKRRSAALKLPQRIASSSIRLLGDAKTIQLRGKISARMANPPQLVTIKRVLCGRYVTVAKAVPSQSGAFVARFPAPNAVAGLYRAETKLPIGARSKRLATSFARAIAIAFDERSG